MPIPEFLKTEPVILTRIIPVQTDGGGSDEQVAETLEERKVEIRAARRATDFPPSVAGVQIAKQEYHYRDDVATPWTDPRTGEERRDLDTNWRIQWKPSDGSASRVLMPARASKWCPIYGQWVTDCIEV